MSRTGKLTGRRLSAGRAPRVTASRRVAFEVLRRVEEEGAYAAPLLASLTEELRPDDRALTYELVLGTLRRQLWLDTALDHFTGRPSASLDPPVRRALRLGLYQLRFLSRIPPSAAVNESVNLAHAERLRSAAGLINAVLRRATREPGYDPALAITDELERAAIETSHPRWLLARWAQAFGQGEALALARANNEAAPLAFRFNSLRAGSDGLLARWREIGLEIVPSRVVPGAWRLAGGSAAPLQESAREGLIYFQDEASQLVAFALAPRPGERIADVCAAPGSKATHLATLMEGRGLVAAGDLYGHRLRSLRETAARQRIEIIAPVAWDAGRALPLAENSFDRVLVDAPCTGTGTLRHNPEIRWRILAPDLVELAQQQKRILQNAARLVRPGGRLVYSTCSVEPEENEAVISAFLAGHSDFAPAREELPLLIRSGGGATARTWPHREGVDGFFIAVLERVGEVAGTARPS